MDGWIEFAKGPLFRLSFGIMTLGLIRLLALSIINGFEAKGKAKEKKLPMNYVGKLTVGFILPIRAFRVKPIYSIVSILFHIGLIFTPLLLFDHALLFHNSIGISWITFAISHQTASILTIITIVSGIVLFIMRTANKSSRAISRKQDYLWPLLLIIPFISGFVCGNSSLNPDAYKYFILIHILSGELIFILMPFTKVAHCLLMPISQWITARSWKFDPEGPVKVKIALNKEGEKL